MGLGFLAPLFLAGLAALAIPLALHLAQRERRDTVPFPSLMFLRRVPHRAERRRRLRHLALLAMRCLALALVAMAFARPLLAPRDADATAAGAGAREVVVLLDRSWSMAYGDRFARARAAARRVVDGLAPGDRASIVLFDAGAAAATPPTADRALLAAALDSARPGALGTRYAPALRLAAQLLRDSDRPRREAVLVTDFQRIAWDGREESRLPTGATLTRIDVGEGASADVAVAAVELGRSMAEGREQLAASARLVNTGDEPARDRAVTLELDGRAVQTRTVTVPARGAAAVAFDAVPIPEGTVRGVVRVAADALPLDDAHYFTARRGAALPVLVVDHAGAGERASLYLRRALAVGRDPAFDVALLRAPAVTAAALAGRSVVVWNDAGAPAAAQARALAAFVRRGGGLVIALGDRAGNAWGGDGAALLAGAPAPPTDRAAERGAAMGAVDRAHPVFAPFAAPRSGDWGAPRWMRYRAIDAGGASPLARFDDGAVALAERRVGEGRVLVWGSGLDTFWSDLPLHPVYLPFVHQLVKHAAGFARERPSRTVGEVLDAGDAIEGGRAAAATELVAQAPSGRRLRLTTADSAGRGARALELTEPGFWELRRADAPAAPPRVVAANLDLAEGDFARIDPAELAAAVSPRADDTLAARAEAAALTPAERERRQAGWWWLLAGALVLLAGETVVGNRIRVGR